VEEIVDAAPNTHADSLWEKTAEVLHRMDPGEEINDIVGNDDSGGEGNEKQTGSSSRRNHRGDKGQRKALQDPPFIMPMTGVPGGIGAPSFDNWTLYMLDDSPLLLHQVCPWANPAPSSGSAPSAMHGPLLSVVLTIVD
jgi:hypothetical protein